MRTPLALILSLAALPALAEEEPRILDCSFTTQCDLASGECVTQEEPLLSFTLLVALEGDSARYEGDETAPEMEVHYTQDGVLVAFDRARSTLTSIGAEGVTVHSSNLILLGQENRAAQWAGQCSPR